MSRNFPTLRYLAAPFRWVMRSRRRVLTAAVVLLAMIAAPVLWWAIQLLGLPDIGDPFDMEAFRSFTIPDDRNAFVLYRQAAAMLKPLKSSRKPSDAPVGQVGPWPKAVAEARRWVEENREAMALYRQGTERPDALDLVPPNGAGSWQMVEALRSFHVLAQFEAARLESRGDMAGAWGWYRAALRATYHAGMRGSAAARMNAQQWHSELRYRLTAVGRRPADDPRLAPPGPRRCGRVRVVHPLGVLHAQGRIPVRGAVAGQARTTRAGFTAQRLHACSTPRTTDWVPEQIVRDRRCLAILATGAGAEPAGAPAGRRQLAGLSGAAPGTGGRAPIPGALRIRLLRLRARGAGRGPRPVARGAGPLARHDHRRHGVAPRLDLRRIRIQERANHRALLVMLASQLYRRDRGTDPPSRGVAGRTLPQEPAR